MFEAAGWHTVMVKYGRAPASGAPALRARIDAMPNEEYQRLLRADAPELRERARGRRLRPRLTPSCWPPSATSAATTWPRCSTATARPTRCATARRSSSPTRSRAGRCPPRAIRPTTRRCSSDAQYAELAQQLGEDADDPWPPVRRRLARGRPVRADGPPAAPRGTRVGAAAAGPARPRPQAHRPRVDPAGVRPLLRRPRARGAGRGRARGHGLARRRHVDQPRRLDQQGRASGASAIASTGSPTTPTRSCAGASPTTAATSSWASPRSTSSGCWASSARRGRATAGRCCRSGTIYDPFVARALEPWSFGIYAGGQSILVGTPSGVTLGPGGRRAPVGRSRRRSASSSRAAWLGAGVRPGLRVGVPARARRGWGARTAARAYFRLSTRPIDQSLHTGHARETATGRRIPPARRMRRPMS